MNPMNQNPPQTSPFPPDNQNPLQFTIFVRQPNPDHSCNPNSIPNPNPNTDSILNPVTNPMLNINSIRNPNSGDLLSLSVPRKRRRGRPRTATLQLQHQVYSLHPFPNSSINGNYGHGSSSLPSSSAPIIKPVVEISNFVNPNYANPSSLTQNVPDVSDEIIVINKESTAEALIALSAGFPADSLTDEEIDAGIVSVVGGIEQVNYILIRNHIITRWRENVLNWVTKEMFVDVVPSHCSTLLDSTYSYLVSHGYINFGVAPAIKEKIPAEPSKSNVVIIGAGLAGLAAARQLMAFGFKVTVLEGRKRAGGRVYTKKMEGASRTAAADLGGSVLTGTHGNPLGILARQLSYSLHKVRDKCPLYRVNGKPVDPDIDSKVETAFNRLLDKASKLRQLMGEVSQDVSLGAALETFWQVYGDAVNAEEMNLFNWHLANLEYANAGLVSKLSLAFWDQDDPYDMGGDHCFLPGGNGRLVQALAENVPILYEKTVHTIRYGSDGVQVVSGSQVFEGDMVLCTVPLGVLKSGSIKFIPELPQRKLDGIKRLGFGLLNKVAMLFPHVFWGTDIDTFGHLSDDPSRRGEFFLFYSYATVAGGPLLLALVAGEAAHKFESMPPTDAVTRVIEILKGIYEPQGIDVPEPIQTVCTRWGSDPFSLGSYSNVAVGASGDDYDILAENVGDGRLFFAGEATTRRYPATMHGAFLSGLREAANMAYYTSARAMRIKVERNLSKNAHSCASLLADLFREPDLEFGSFSVIFAKKISDPKSTAILRVTFSGPRKKSHEGSRPDQQHSNKLLFQQLHSHFNHQQELHVYTLLSRQQAFDLREVRGGDEMRLNYLCEKLGVKLVGRKGLGSTADSVIASIKAERGNRKPASTSLTLKSGASKPKSSTLKRKMVRMAKVMGSSNGSALPLNLDAGAKAVGSSIPSILPLNSNVGAKIVGNSNGSTPLLNNNAGAKLLVSSNTSNSPANIQVDSSQGSALHPILNVVNDKSTGENVGPQSSTS
ncbi:protein FLOWERING LOCUS D [Cornus florida]|uniref:protein FLOWERING LOCUS D n=1 Tax=Cornus florida TaxID=4283 RepID=UPI0028A1298E|nr:protein FLOWERING LOCUS D [Cornus florida]XP_059666041.1 protein FLOWERING LOCUS D [Cornus florida]XP_059666043.1 protein FLOWERING LOCUS D [Cornus florida]XP_059666044.1 protein FLOWERING LOCUS D [Cornus florida]